MLKRLALSAAAIALATPAFAHIGVGTTPSFAAASAMTENRCASPGDSRIE